MNILPLTLSLCLLFSCLCFSFLREMRSSLLSSLTFESYHHTEKALKNTLIRHAFNTIKEDPAPSSEKRDAKETHKKWSSRRESYPPTEGSKFYLRALTKAEAPLERHPLYEPLATLLRLLYQDRLFSQYPHLKKPEYALTESLIKKIQKFPTAKTLANLYPDEEALRPLYYKMLKGTNSYSREEGIPPLSHFLSLDAQDRAILVCSASPLLLEACFGATLSQQLLALEKQQQASLSKESAEALFLKDPALSLLLPSLQPYLSYSPQVHKKKTIAKRDPLTGLGIEQERPL